MGSFEVEKSRVTNGEYKKGEVCEAIIIISCDREREDSGEFAHRRVPEDVCPLRTLVRGRLPATDFRVERIMNVNADGLVI